MMELGTAIFILCLSTFPTALAGPGVRCSFIEVDDDTAVLTSLNLQVYCGADSIVVTINPCVLEQMYYDPSVDVTINGYGENAQSFDTGVACAIAPVYAFETSWTFTILDPFTQCLMDLSTDTDEITYQNAVRTIGHSNVGGPSIVRRKNIYAPFSCTYNTSFVNSGLGPIEPNVLVLSGSGEAVSGDFAPLARICYDDDCSVPVPDDTTIDVCTQLYLVVTTSNTNLKINIIRVWVTDTPWGSYTYIADLVSNGCLQDDDNYASLINPGAVDGTTFLCFRAFHFGGDADSDIYFHVEYELCDPGTGSCLDPCDRRRRRSLGAHSSKNTVTETLGPFRTVVA